MVTGSVWVAQHHHAERVSHQDGIDSYLVKRQGGRIVIGGEHGNGLAALFLAL
jgi:hypothetical protein